MGSTLATFPRFNELPEPIRHHIWVKALPGPRVVIPRIQELQEENISADKDEWDLSQRKPCTLKSWAPSLYLVSKDAHKSASWGRSNSFGGINLRGTYFFNSKIDTLYLSGDIMAGLGKGIYTIDDLGPAIAWACGLIVCPVPHEEAWLYPKSSLLYAALLPGFGSVEYFGIADSASDKSAHDLVFIPLDEWCVAIWYRNGFALNSDMEMEQDREKCKLVIRQWENKIFKAQQKDRQKAGYVRWKVPKGISRGRLVNPSFREKAAGWKMAYEEGRRLFSMEFKIGCPDGSNFKYVVDQSTIVEQIISHVREPRETEDEKEVRLRCNGRELEVTARILGIKDLQSTNALDIVIS